jgi:hypothetical protein
MKGHNMNHKRESLRVGARTDLSTVSLSSCRNLIAKIDILKQRLFREFSGEVAGSDRVLKGALNEAESLAWQTPFPHLFFPVLAQEKAVEATQWARHQQEVQSQGMMAFAA